jgi:hypothetical protein
MTDFNDLSLREIKEMVRDLKIQAVNIPEINRYNTNKYGEKKVISHLDDVIDIINHADEGIDLKNYTNGSYILQALAYAIHECDTLQEWTPEQKLLSIHLQVIYDAWYYFIYRKSPNA